MAFTVGQIKTMACIAAVLAQACGESQPAPAQDAAAALEPVSVDGVETVLTPAEALPAITLPETPDAAVAEEDDCPTLGLPERAADAPTGSEFLQATDHLSQEEREHAIYDEIMRGNVPSFLRQLRPVTLATLRSPNHGEADAMKPRPNEATICVMPDYLAIGSDAEFVRMPMNLFTANRIALALGFVLPTTKVVDAIHQQAAARVKPHTLRPSSDMTRNATYLRHNEMIDADFGAYPRGAIVSGHKKDVVVATKRRSRPGSIGLYGWLQHDGIPIQRLSDAHDASYVDYAQGVRLVGRTIRLANGTTIPYVVAIRHRETAALLTDEGPTNTYGAFTSEAQFAATNVAGHR
jgi:hypothetical protein